MAQKAVKYTSDLIFSELKQKIYRPIYFLEGEEPYYIDKIADFIEKNVLDEMEKEFNQTILYGKDTDVLTLINECKRYPMMADKQVVILREAQELNFEKTVETKNAAGKKDEINLFEEYVKNPTNSTVLVICYKYGGLDKRRALAKTLSTHAVYFNSEKLKDYKVQEWVEAYLKERKLNFEQKVPYFISENLGNDLAKIENEVDKLLLNIKDKTQITVADVIQNISVSKEYNMFELTNAIMIKDVLKVNKIINYFAANPKDNPVPLLMGTLYSFFIKLIGIHTLTDRSQYAIASKIGVPPFIAKDYEAAARQYSPGKLVKIIGYLREYDKKSKGIGSNTMPNGELMKELFFKILH
ncbi:MAG: DNA polymerase III subunit delta [Bacteroidota bacterium]